MFCVIDVDIAKRKLTVSMLLHMYKTYILVEYIHRPIHFRTFVCRRKLYLNSAVSLLHFQNENKIIGI